MNNVTSSVIPWYVVHFVDLTDDRKEVILDLFKKKSMPSSKKDAVVIGPHPKKKVSII